MLVRIHLLATMAWGALAAGAGLGFVARDVLGLPQPWVGLAWVAGALLAAALAPASAGGGARPRAARHPPERGQAAVEFTALILLAALALGALASFGPRVDGRSFAGFLAHRVTCAATRTCQDGDAALRLAYGPDQAELVRRHAPNLVYESGERQLPVDWRRCRDPDCAGAPDEPDLDVHRSDSGERATAFTRVVRSGGHTFLQYWLYYPDSDTSWPGSDALDVVWALPPIGFVRRDSERAGFHRDDWEGYVVRLGKGGRAWARASSHAHWQGCKEEWCKNDWTAPTGWTRVSRGSHAGHIPLRHELVGRPPRVSPRQVSMPGEPRARTRWVPLLPGHDLHERTTTGEGLRLVPLETHDKSEYVRHADGVAPPWEKDAYRDPESDES